MQVLYIFFELSYCYCPCVSKLKMLLPPRYLQQDLIYLYHPCITAEVALIKKRQMYKRTMQTQIHTVISNPTYCLFIYLGSVHLIKFYDCWIDFIIIAILINHQNWPIYYNAMVKLAILMLLKGILLGLVWMFLKCWGTQLVEKGGESMID